MHATALDLPLSRLDDLRRRTVRVLFSGVALGSTGHIAAVTVATIVAEDLSGSPLLSGAPGAAVVLGAAVGAASLSRLMVARGRRIGLSSGYVIGPNLVAWAGDVGESIGLPPLAGAYLLPIVFVGSAAILSFAMLRPDPYRLADRSDLGADDRSTAVSLRAVLAHPNVPIAMVS